jgi:hypothetical protein
MCKFTKKRCLPEKWYYFSKTLDPVRKGLYEFCINFVVGKFLAFKCEIEQHSHYP